MTNGDMIKDLYNPYKICEYEYSVHVYMTEEDFWKSDYQINCNTSWWNAPCNKEKESAKVLKQESIIDKIRAEIEGAIQEETVIDQSGGEYESVVSKLDPDDVFQIIDKYRGESKESATVATFHDFYPEDSETWPPADKEILVKRHTGDNFIAYLEFDDSEDGGWGFYSEDGDFIADLDEIAAWMPIPQHERDKNYIPVWEREKKTIPAKTHEDADEDIEEEKDR